jgi:hypothetical protein
MYKYNVSILTMFKNESIIIKEWMEYYIKNQEIEHFYLIDNGSTDNYEEIISKYSNYYDLIKDNYRQQFGTQKVLFNKYFLDKIKKETKWIIVIDIDEYIYCTNNQTINSFLSSLNTDEYDSIYIPWKIFGSSNFEKQPDNIINSFILRENNNDILTRITKWQPGFFKEICLTKNINVLNIHECGTNIKKKIYKKNELIHNSNIYLTDFPIKLNHYMVMSKEYYEKVKCSRGGGASSKCYKYTMNYFNDNLIKYNMIEDLELKNILDKYYK